MVFAGELYLPIHPADSLIAAGHGHRLSADKIVKIVESSPETLELLIVPQAVSCRIVEKLPTLPMDTLKKLLKDDIPRLLCDDKHNRKSVIEKCRKVFATSYIDRAECADNILDSRAQYALGPWGVF